MYNSGIIILNKQDGTQRKYVLQGVTLSPDKNNILRGNGIIFDEVHCIIEKVETNEINGHCVVTASVLDFGISYTIEEEGNEN